ncbi:MAG: magnesium/cobalt transporter CorA [Pseudonocardiales bacterium]
MIVDCAVYRDGSRLPGELDLEAAFEAAGESEDSFVWIGLFEPDASEFAAVVEEFHLPSLAVEDALHAHQRPKFELYDQMAFLVLKPAGYAPDNIVELGQVVLFIGRNFVVSVRQGESSSLHDVRLRLEKQPELLKCGPSAVVYAVLDRVVDDYVEVLDKMDELIDEVERSVFSGAKESQAQSIYRLKRAVVQFQRAAVPMHDAVSSLIHGPHPTIHEDAREYVRDVQDHLTRSIDHLAAMDTLLNGVLSANLAEVGIRQADVGIRQNEDMRKISAWVAIVAVPTLIAGVYGMNFDHMPELRWKYGYGMALALMAACCGGLYRSFKRNGWL